MENNEQLLLQQIKQWFKANSFYIIAFLVLSIGGSGGWNYWKQTQLDYKNKASDLYQKVIDFSAEDNLTQARASLTILEKNYTDTAYPFLGNLSFAKEAFRLGNMTMSKEALQWVVTNSEDENFIFAAADRLARLLISEKQPQKVLDVINDALGKISNESSAASLNMSLGDAYLQQNNVELARSFYQTAKKNLPPDSILKELIEMKLRNASSL
jgi:predicted negative regulator of RcsB-dependent stress response